MQGNQFVAEMQDYDGQTALAVSIVTPDGNQWRNAVSVYAHNPLTPWGMAAGMRGLADWIERKMGPAPRNLDKRKLLI
jgi:hypothetical protein